MVHARRDSLASLAEAAAAVALSVLLGNLRLLELPNGGSIALATLPLLALAIVRGPRVGVLAGAGAGMAHAISGGTIVHPAQLGLDYFLAYAALGLAGIGPRGTSRLHLAPGILLAMTLHLAAMVTSGVIFFSTVAGSAALEYALAYNALTVVPETILALWLAPPLTRALARANPADSWRRGLLTPPPPIPRGVRRHSPPAPMSIDTRLTPPPAAVTAGRVDGDTRIASRARATSFVRPTPFSRIPAPSSGTSPSAWQSSPPPPGSSPRACGRSPSPLA